METVVFVDDEVRQAKGYIEALTKAGYRVLVEETVESGKNSILENHEAKCVVLDVMMPFATVWGDPLENLGGLKVYKEIISALQARQTPVILLTRMEKDDVERKTERIRTVQI